MKNNNIPLNKYENDKLNSYLNNNTNLEIDINNLNNNDIQSLKNSLNKLRNICNILKEKNTIIDGMLLSTKKRKKILSQETLEKESELLNLENEINIYYNKLFSDYIHTDNNKRIILSKLKLIREELTQRKYTDYLNKKIMVEQKEDKIQKELSKLSTEQLEVFNNEIFNIQKYNNKDNPNIEAMKKHYEDIKKSDIYQKVFSEIKESLFNEKNNNTQSMSYLINNDNSNNITKKFKSKMINESSNYFQPYSNGNFTMRSNMFSNQKKKQRINNSVDTKYTMSNDNYFKNGKKESKFLFDYKNIRNKSFAFNNYSSKKKKRFNSKLFMANNNS